VLSAASVLAGCATVDPTDPYASEPIARHLERDDDVGIARACSPT